MDDPRGAVERAAAAASEVAASLVATLEREQSELRAAWQQNADIEQLRTALQRYRAFCGRLEGLAWPDATAARRHEPPRAAARERARGQQAQPPAPGLPTYPAGGRCGLGQPAG